MNSGPIAIENRVGYGSLRLEPGRYVWRSFTATFDPEPRTGLRIELDIEVDRAGNPHCRGLRLANNPYSHAWEDSIRTDTLRQLPVRTLIDEAFRTAIEPMVESHDDSGDLILERDESVTAAELDALYPKGAKRSKERRPLGDDELRRLADFYRAAVERGQLPTKVLAERFRVHPSTPRRWFQRGVERGYLEPDDRLGPADGARRPRRPRAPRRPRRSA